MGGNVAVDVWICSIVNCCHSVYRPNMDLLVEMNLCMRIPPLTMNLLAGGLVCRGVVTLNGIQFIECFIRFEWIHFEWERRGNAKRYFFNSSSAGMVHSIIHFSFTQRRENSSVAFAMLCYQFICISWFYCESSRKPSEIYLVCLSRKASESVGCEIYAGAIHLLLISRARLRDIFERLTFHRFSAILWANRWFEFYVTVFYDEKYKDKI